MDVQRLTSALRLEAQLTEKTQEPTAQQAADFSAVLSKALQQVETDQVVAREAAQKLATGEVKDIAEVMIASEKATLSLALTLQVRNKLLEAYQEIMRTQL